jgi:predicted GTPase
MSVSKPFDLNVAIIGNVSAGKSTLLNALLRAKYSEVAMKRTTAGVNYFRLHKKPPDVKLEELASTSDESVDGVETTKTPSSTLQEISSDNEVLREKDVIQEKYFDVEMEENICSDMHDEIRLVLVDTPGINEAQTGSKCKDYLISKWRTFDCVIVVMDGKQGVNTDDQLTITTH